MHASFLVRAARLGTAKAARVFLRASCHLIDHPAGTGQAVGKSSLRLSLPTLDPAHQPHPGEHLRQGAGQGEVVGDIVIAPCIKLQLQPSPLQSTHACCTQAVSFCAVLLHRWMAASRDGTHQRWLPSAVRAFIAFWRSLCHLWGTDQPFLEELSCCDRAGSQSLVLARELLVYLFA